MDRKAAKGDPVGRAHDHDPARRIALTRPRAKRGRRNRARIDDARMRRDDDLWRDASVGSGACADVADQRAKARRLSWIEETRHLCGMDLKVGLARHVGPQSPRQNVMLYRPPRQCAALQSGALLTK